MFTSLLTVPWELRMHTPLAGLCPTRYKRWRKPAVFTDVSLDGFRLATRLALLVYSVCFTKQGVRIDVPTSVHQRSIINDRLSPKAYSLIE